MTPIWRRWVRGRPAQIIDRDLLRITMTMDIAPARFWIFGRGTMGNTDQTEAHKLVNDIVDAYERRRTRGNA